MEYTKAELIQLARKIDVVRTCHNAIEKLNMLQAIQVTFEQVVQSDAVSLIAHIEEGNKIFYSDPIPMGTKNIHMNAFDSLYEKIENLCNMTLEEITSSLLDDLMIRPKNG